MPRSSAGADSARQIADYSAGYAEALADRAGEEVDGPHDHEFEVEG